MAALVSPCIARSDPARPPGYWKWEATVTQAGDCQVPRQPQIDAYLAETQAKVAARAK